MATAAGPSKADVAWLTECRRRLRRLVFLRIAPWLDDDERRLVLHALWYVRRDFDGLGLVREADYLIRSGDLVEEMRRQP